jgi:hypothetical protein
MDNIHSKRLDALNAVEDAERAKLERFEWEAIQYRNRAVAAEASLAQTTIKLAAYERVVTAYPKLRAIAHAAWHACDDSENGQIPVEGYNALCDALDLEPADDDIHEWLQWIDAAEPTPFAP